MDDKTKKLYAKKFSTEEIIEIAETIRNQWIRCIERKERKIMELQIKNNTMKMHIYTYQKLYKTKI